MTQKYDIESLIETFEKHHTEVEKERKEQLEKFLEEYAGSPIPDHMQNEFSISKALSEICKEIKAIKDDVGKIWDHILGIED